MTDVTRYLGIAILAFVLSPQPAVAQTEDAHDEVTFSKDIAPILQRSCQKCHRPNSLAPMSLIAYEEVRPWARAIKYRTGLRDQMGVMPPWYIEKDIGIQRFKDDPSLTDEEVATIAAWADNGAPQGNPADMPTPPPFIDVDEWEIGEPDLIVSSPTFEMDSLAPDWWGSLGSSQTGLTEDRYVAAIEYKEVTESRGEQTRTTVGGLFTIHHAGMLSTDPENKRARMTWPVHEVGRNADVFDVEAGRLLKAGAELNFYTTHLHSNGADTKGRLDVAFKFHPAGYEPTKDWQFLFFGNGADIDIPANVTDHQQDAYFTLPKNAKISVFEPHMHAPGVRMCLDAAWGNTVQTLNCAGYDHNWVRVYKYEDDAAPLLPKGTILHLKGYFNNSASNPNVVDPRNWSGAGHRSVDNMFINLMQAIYLTDEEFEAELEKRRGKLLTEGGTDIGCITCGRGEAPATAGGGQ
jgi:hypothetical protein